MKALYLVAVLGSLATSLPVRGEAHASPVGTSAASSTDPTLLVGKWTYRSFHNNPTLIGGDPNKALELIFAEAEFTFKPAGNAIEGTIDWPGGGLDLRGTIATGADGSPVLAISGMGRPGSGTDGWEYDYRAQFAYIWPNGVDQRPALVGTVIRAKPHDGAPAGYVASFIAVKQP